VFSAVRCGFSRLL